MPATAAQIRELTSKQRAALLARARAGFVAAPAAGPAAPIPARPRPDGLARASCVQDQIWIAERMCPGVPMHNVSFALHLTGALDPDRLVAAVAELIRRHPILTSHTVLTPDGLAVRSGAVPIPVTAVRDLTAASDPARRARARVEALARTRFDLDAGPWVRTELIRQTQDHYILMFVAHHAAIDGASFDLLLARLGALYEHGGEPGAAADGGEAAFGDYAEWQREQLIGERLDRLVEHWRGRLGEAEPAVLAPDLPRPQSARHRGRNAWFDLPDDTTGALRTLAAQRHTTLFVVLLSVFGDVLARRTGRTRATVGVPMACRTTPQTQRMIGPFSNTVPVVLTAAPGRPMAETIARVSDALLDAAQHQEVPVTVLVDRLHRTRDAARNPLFQILVNMGNLPGGTAETGFAKGVRLRPEAVPNGTVRVDLELTFDVSGERLAGRIEYDEDLYRPETVAALAAELRERLIAVSAATGSGTRANA